MAIDKSFKKLNTNKIQKIFRLLQFSPMPRKEKLLWVKLIPYMSSKQVEKFSKILEFENSKMTDLALNLLERQAIDKKL